jgi:D-serine deaminase-like pyridoxal phosphate-dependent protein
MAAAAALTDADAARWSSLLARSGADGPRLLVDLERFDRNLERALARIGSRAPRLVVKSLPCPALIERVLARLPAPRLMCFHRPFLDVAVRRWPGIDVLMGKPLPAAAIRRHLEQARRDGVATDPAWLVDTPQAVDAVASIARALGRGLRIAIELDVGLRRGGCGDAAALEAILARSRAAGESLRLAGFVGYEAHVAKAPWPIGPRRAARAVARRYRELLEVARRAGVDPGDGSVLHNGGGSASFAWLDAESPVDDVAIGSLLLKPSDFDLPWLAEFEPALWIATPVLKRLSGVRIPYLGRIAGRGRDALFLYGGRWMAQPAWPRGLSTQPLYGLSSNQQMMTVPRAASIAVGDFAYFRPTQSEAVMLQFGPILARDAAEGLHCLEPLTDRHGDGETH